MTDFINKVITIVLIFVMLVLAPLLISYMSTDMVAERLILNDVTQFIDKVTDKGLLTNYDLNDLYLAVNSHGGAYEVKVERYQLLEEPLPNGSTKLLYLKHDDVDNMMEGTVPDYINLNVKDVVKVHVEEVSLSTGKRLLWSVLRVDKGKFEFSLAGTVR